MHSIPHSLAAALWPVPVAVAALEVRGDDGRRIETLAPSTVGVVWVDVSSATRRRIPRAIEHRLTYDVGPGLSVGPKDQRRRWSRRS